MLFGNLSQLDCTPSSTRYYCSCYYMRLNEHRIITIQIQRVYLSETTNEDTNEHTNICNIQSNDFSIDISFNRFFVPTNSSWCMIPFFENSENSPQRVRNKVIALQIKTFICTSQFAFHLGSISSFDINTFYLKFSYYNITEKSCYMYFHGNISVN